MRTVLSFTLAAALCVALAWWVAGLPGDVAITVAGTTIETRTPVAITLVGLLFVILYLLIRFVAGLARLPANTRRWRRERRRSGGDAAVTRTLIALAANDANAARREAGRTRRLLGDTPLTLLLAAQAGRQAGREAEATEIFGRLADRADGRLLGVRGLLRQAVAAEDWDAARELAVRAEAAHPGATWLADERRRMALHTGQWREALHLSGPSRGRNADPGARAALGVAAADEEKDPNAALRLAKQAWEAEPSLAPAALAYSGRLRSGGQERPALDVLRRTWSLRPHPDLAEAYSATMTEPATRMRAAQELASANPAHPDSALMLARTALDAGQVPEARRHIETARRAGLQGRRLWLLLADIAETEGDHDAAQEALRHIPGAAADPVWRCLACGTVHPAWHPVCDACGTPGRITWTADTAQQAGSGVASRPAAIEGFG